MGSTQSYAWNYCPDSVCCSVRHRYDSTMPIPPVDPTTDSVGVVKGVVGKVAASPSGQIVRPRILPHTSSIFSISPGFPCPASIR